jgi:hypothetical protein
MSNNLERFIADNRGDFDDRQPSDQLWQNVEASLMGKQKKQSVLTPFVKWAMAAAAVLMIGFSVYFLVQKNKPDVEPIAKTELGSDVPDAPEVNEFAKMIAVKQEELKVLGKEQPELYQRFISDITQLDSSYNSLKNQLSISPNREVLLQAMIQNLQLQLNVLNQQLNIINEIKQSKNFSHEKNTKTI